MSTLFRASIMLALLALLSIAPVAAQVSLEYTPMPLAVMNSLHFTTLGPWSCRACNNGPASLTLAPERIYMAAPSIHWVDGSLAVTMLAQKQAQSWQSKGAEVAELAIDAAGMFGGTGTWFKISANGLAKLAAGSAFAHYLQGKFQGSIPSITPFTASLLSGPVTLAPKGTPGDCATFTMYAGKMKNPQPVTSSITFLPVPVPAPTSNR